MEFLRFGVGVGGKDGFAVVDEVFGGTAVNENAEAPQRVLERHVQDLADSHIEALVEACPVDRAGL